MRMVYDKGAARRVGRPPRVDSAQIAEAALAIGLEHATIRNVAEHLGMSVPGLYHHVRTREDLVAMAAAHSLSTLELPEDNGQPVEEWLRDYATFVHDALVAQPELVGQILAGTVNTLREAQHLEAFLGVLARRGSTIPDAYDDFELLMAAVVGAATSAIGHASAEAAGHPRLDDLRRAATAFGPDESPLVHELVSRRRRRPDTFEVVDTVITRIATRLPD